MPDLAVGREAAQHLVKNAPLTPERLAHTLAVGAAAHRMIVAMGRPEAWVDQVAATAVLHDIGYGYPETGHHAVDGGRFLRTIGAPAEVCAQVAWHSTAEHEVTARGLPLDLSAEFGTPDPLVRAIIWCADFTTSPTGLPVAVGERLGDIEDRYPVDSPVIEALHAARPAMEEAWSLLTETPDLQLPPEAHPLPW